ncbi:hypothetical protein [Flavobacterium caeni]|uniref:Uncharacterized protein n=1 Tax=Flavobacterium caeni TaxID=490189 RepID=A0A1G5KB02_9FLAO|nr:hypothetical protein [Flavobacterium caeni]SCY97793.1 hypothetical protein SAMN02927903_03213 [Flavobacterium caeni]
MNTVKSTSEILAFKILNRNVNNVWINWAIEMLMAGFDSENLLYLAGENEQTNQFELQKIADRALNELKLDYSDREIVIENYICYLLDEAILEKRSYESVLKNLKDLCIELDYESSLYDFYSLYYAQDDLKYSTHQWYWENANRENINQIIKDYFYKRKASCT